MILPNLLRGACASLCLFSLTASAEDPLPAAVSKGADPASKLINAWFAEGKAAGLAGVFYDNRDRKHSDLGIATYPQLQPITYTEEQLAAKADWGGQGQIHPGKIIIGNSSTASPATQAGSHQRMYYTHPQGLGFLYNQSRTNALYIYPEHRDHDPGTNGPDGYGDLYPANSPYLISSQGSSGSDRVFLHAFLKTIAAFPPDTREALISHGLLMPTLQAIFRQTYKASAEPGDYFTGKAHPSAFEGNLIDELGMVKLAQSLTPDAIPPLVVLRVTDELEPVSGRDFFEPHQFVAGEKLADSPCAISRVFRASAFRRTFRISAAGSAAPHGKPLKFRWSILRGDPDLISITPAGEGGAEATLSIAYHPRRPISPGSELSSNRVDIGVFAEAEGSLTSAPAFVTFTSLPNEHRTYSDEGQLLEIFYGARSHSLGIPPADSARWDALLAQCDLPQDARSPGFLTVASHFSASQSEKLTALSVSTNLPRSQLSAAAEKLDTITAAQQTAIDEANKARAEAAESHKKLTSESSKPALDHATAEHASAQKAMREGADGAAELKAEIAGLRSQITKAVADAEAPAILDSTLTLIRSDPQFFSKNETAIRDAAARSTRPKAPDPLDAALLRLASVGVTASDDPTPGERYHLGQLNADILSEILLPDFLMRPPGPNYVDPRLTAPKLWRDVYHYHEDGSPAGWTRFQNAVSTEFTAQGERILSRKPDGSPDSVAKVRYVFNPQSKQLEAADAE